MEYLNIFWCLNEFQFDYKVIRKYSFHPTGLSINAVLKCVLIYCRRSLVIIITFKSLGKYQCLGDVLDVQCLGDCKLLQLPEIFQNIMILIIWYSSTC